MIRFACPMCGKHIKASEADEGKTGKCPRCGEQVRISGPRDTLPTLTSEAPTASPPPKPPITPEPGPMVATPAPSSPAGEIILCYACRRKVADNAATCPKCGAVQSAAGREKGRKLKKQSDLFAGVGALVVLVPCFLCCLGTMFGGSRKSDSPPKGPANWDMNRLKEDVRESVRDPNKTIIVPYDGSQPRLVPNTADP